MPARPAAGTGRMVLVRLSQVPLARRLAAADRLIASAGLTGPAAINIKMAAVEPRQNPAVLVTAEEARRKGVKL